MDTTNSSNCDPTPYLKKRFRGIRYGYRPKRYNYSDAAWSDYSLKDWQKIGEFLIAEINILSIPPVNITVFGGRLKEGIRYRIANQAGPAFAHSTITAPGPLSLGELIDFINGSGEEDEKLGVAILYEVYNNRFLPDIFNNLILPEVRLGPLSEMGKDMFDHLKDFMFNRIITPYYKQLRVHYENVYSEWYASISA
jgi:hypothetical protein